MNAPTLFPKKKLTLTIAQQAQVKPQIDVDNVEDWFMNAIFIAYVGQLVNRSVDMLLKQEAKAALNTWASHGDVYTKGVLNLVIQSPQPQQHLIKTHKGL